jgi:hypothetical protein
MQISPDYASVGVEEICQPQFEYLELDIPRGYREGQMRFTVSYCAKMLHYIPLEGGINPSYKSPIAATIVTSEVVLTTFNITSLTVYTRTIIQFRIYELQSR